jgi:rhodanese-related sulfurtransferase
MATPDIITVVKLARLIGTHETPMIVDVRIDNDHASDPRVLPASIRRDHRTVSTWVEEYANRFVVVVCQRGQKLSQGVAAWQRRCRQLPTPRTPQNG